MLPPHINHVPVDNDLNVGLEISVETLENILFESNSYINIKDIITQDRLLSCGSSITNELEIRIRGQSENPLWFLCRKGRITASIFH